MTADDIRRVRLTLGMTQQEFATALGVSVRSISDWELGKSRPHRLALAAIRRLQRRAERTQAGADPAETVRHE